MFQKSSFSISEEKYVYVKVAKLSNELDHFMVAQDEDEITVVTRQEKLSELEVIEKNDNLWRLVSLNLETPFMAGTLAAINSACAKEGLNNLIISTYSKDYIVIKDSQVEQVKAVLQGLGFKDDSQ